MTLAARVTATAFASLLLMGTAFAQTSPPAAAPMAKSDSMEKPRSEASLACSKDADSKNIHGKPRKKFMRDCKKAAKTKP